MKKLILLSAAMVLIVTIVGCVSISKVIKKPDNGCCPTYTYEGYYVTADGVRQEITMSMMIPEKPAYSYYQF